MAQHSEGEKKTFVEILRSIKEKKMSLESNQWFHECYEMQHFIHGREYINYNLKFCNIYGRRTEDIGFRAFLDLDNVDMTINAVLWKSVWRISAIFRQRIFVLNLNIELRHYIASYHDLKRYTVERQSRHDDLLFLVSMFFSQEIALSSPHHIKV